MAFAIAVVTKASGATCVLLAQTDPVGAVGRPVNAGDAFGANEVKSVPESLIFPRPSEVITSPVGAVATLAAAVAAVVVLPEPATVTVPEVVIGPPVAIPEVA